MCLIYKRKKVKEHLIFKWETVSHGGDKEKYDSCHIFRCFSSSNIVDNDSPILILCRFPTASKGLF